MKDKKEWGMGEDGFYNPLFESKKDIEKIKIDEPIKRLIEDLPMNKAIENQPIKKMSNEEKKEELKKFNNDPITKINDVIAVNKGSYYAFKILTIVILVAFSTLLIVNVFMFNSYFKDKDFSPKVENINNIDLPETQITNEYNNTFPLDATININISIDKIIVNQNST